jgi:hypothetical protein
MKVPSLEQIKNIEYNCQKAIKDIANLASIATRSMKISDINQYNTAIEQYLNMKKIINNYFKELI